ncbi:hypothetical protein PR048_013551 [Dryococelus australis]|uniref:PiggyBac transposable element-derived protein domain-containing protein n=1 Tax=Dryococelus australis TaxID=614101 RepID=A0ABQ9HSM9_9NEOP|nr:hypothetical protein PR048_013551 [Dryococelus australis]
MNSYICNFKICVGKDKTDGTPAGTAIVMEMMQKCDLLNKEYSLYTDIGYSLPNLFHRLFSAGTNECGTVHINRKHMPKELVKEKLKVGEAVAYNSNNITAMKWKDKREVCILSTKHTLDFAETGSRALYKKLNGKKDRMFHVFKQRLEQQLLESYFKEDMVKRQSVILEDLPSRLSGRHFPEKLAPSATKGAKFTKRCVVCLEKEQRMESTWKCDSCNVALCIEHFKPYYTLKNY